MFEGNPPAMVLEEMLRICKDSKFAISKGREPVRLVADNIRVLRFLNCPISGGIDPNRGMSEMFRDITWELSSHVTPEKEQCMVGEEDGFQSSRPEPLGPTRDAFNFNRSSCSE
uniref:Uncharacterized protein n=1 Tax=Opuntia streptacantha TaxID=393608 RepID=A0A7C9DUJ4_OPUST